MPYRRMTIPYHANKSSLLVRVYLFVEDRSRLNGRPQSKHYYTTTNRILGKTRQSPIEIVA